MNSVRSDRLALAVLTLSISVATAALGFAAVSPQPAPARAQEDLELGREIYVTDCEPCHGATGEGDGPAARFLESRPRDLTSNPWIYVAERTVDNVATLVADGIPDTEMEPFGEFLEADEIRAVSAYVVAQFVAGDSE